MGSLVRLDSDSLLDLSAVAFGGLAASRLVRRSSLLSYPAEFPLGRGLNPRLRNRVCPIHTAESLSKG